MKRFKIFTILSLFAVLFTLCSCDDHEPIDANIYPGYILTTDHRIMSLNEFQSSSHVNAEGVIYALANEKHPMLVVLLDEVEEVQFADSLYSQGTSADVMAFDGFVNTTQLQNSYDAKTFHGSPLGKRVIEYQSFGQSAYIPSVAEMNTLLAVAKTVNHSLEAIGATPIKTEEDCWYWTSTEVESNKNNQAWLLSGASGSYQPTVKTECHRARPIISIYY